MKKESYEAALVRIYHSYVEKPLKNTNEYASTGIVSQMTLESVIENSQMGIQNEVIKEKLKQYIVENESALLAIPVLDEQKKFQVNSIRRRLALKVGRLKAKRRRHEKMPYEQVRKKSIPKLRLESTRLKNYLRMDPFLALFSKPEIGKIERLEYTISRPRLRKNGQFTVRYRNKVINQNQFIKLLGG
jgi:hypothetical protein